MSEVVRLRLTSDGTPRGTRLETDDGKLVKGVQAVRWGLDMNGLAMVSFDVLGVPVDIVGLVEVPNRSFLEDPTKPVAGLTEPQAMPEGPGFTANLEHEIIRTGADFTVDDDDEGLPDEVFVCPLCGMMYDDADQICVGDDIHGQHDPEKVKLKSA